MLKVSICRCSSKHYQFIFSRPPKYAEQSGSSLGKKLPPISIIVTFDPSLAKAYPSSHPIGPLPMINISAGSDVKLKILSDV